jgi:RHS repeat-associated protein
VYDPTGNRVYVAGNGSNTPTMFFNSVTGDRIVYGTAWWDETGGPMPEIHFAGKLIQSNGGYAVTDRQGTVRYNGSAMNYLPYGEELSSTANEQTKFATYFRDSALQDYAQQRYYNNWYGRFMTPDPSGAADPTNPTSWNMYMYANGDPVNFNDPTGLDSNGPVCSVLVDGDCGEEPDCDVPSLVPIPGCSYPCGGDSLFPNPVCFYPGPPETPAPPPISATCEAVNGIPSSVATPQLDVLLGENSWGQYNASAVAQEDLYMEQAIYNYAAPKGFATSSASVDTTINSIDYQGYSHGQSVMTSDLQSSATSSFCQDLTTAENAYNQFWNGSHSFSNVNQWRTANGSPGPGQIQIAGTFFFYTPGAFYSPTRHPTPVPPGKPRVLP